jgi:tetrapyrrole methylase family protein/MazG family protein
VHEYPQKPRYDLDDLRAIVQCLRAPDGCPWDREQTHESIRKNMIEECYEAVEAINKADPVLLTEELGDVLLQVYLHAQIAQDAGAFTLDDVADGICKKLLLRHPHVFGDQEAADGEAALANWDAVKRATKGQAPGSAPMLSVPREFPALMRAQKVQKKAQTAGLDFPDIAATLQKIGEELGELTEAVHSDNAEAIADELGDLLFSAVNTARFADVDAEEVLTQATDKFIRRFTRLEQVLDKPIAETTAAALDAAWEQIKRA